MTLQSWQEVGRLPPRQCKMQESKQAAKGHILVQHRDSKYTVLNLTFELFLSGMDKEVSLRTCTWFYQGSL